METTVTDPRGYEISCDENQWVTHIVAGHPVMRNNKSAVEYTIKNPDTIYQSNEYGDRDVYFAKSPNTTYDSRFYTKVIVQMDEPHKKGEIVTTFPCPHIDGGIDEKGIKYVKPKL